MVAYGDCCIRYPVGTRLKIGEHYGTVKYVGEVSQCIAYIKNNFLFSAHFFKVFGHVGVWLGVEWDDVYRGKHNGSLDGRHYFQTQHPTAGTFIRPGKLGPCESLEEAARSRYLTHSANYLDLELLRDAQQHTQASIFEVVGMDQIARKQSKFEQLTEISVDNSTVNSAGFLKNFSMLSTLDLSHTSIWNWQIVADIVRQIPSLTILNLR